MKLLVIAIFLLSIVYCEIVKCAKDDRNCASEFMTNDPNTICVKRQIVRLSDLRNAAYIRAKAADPSFKVNVISYTCMKTPTAIYLNSTTGKLN